MLEKRTFLYLSISLLIAAVYVLARAWNLTASCLWFDEIFSVHAARHEWATLFSFVAQDVIHPPFFYVLLKVWITFGGENLLWLRLFPVTFAILAIVPFMLLARELKLSRAAILGAFALLAVNGSLIKYAQEVRMYSVIFCFALISIWLFARFLNSGERLIFVALFVVNLLLIYTHYFGWLIIFAELIAVFIVRRERGRQFLISTGLLLLGFAPWIWAVWQARQASAANLNQNLGWAAKPGLNQILQFAANLHEPFYFQQSSGEPLSVWLISIPIALICLSAITFLFVKRQNENLILLVIFAVVPLIAAFVSSWILPFSVWGTRHLIIVFPFYFLLAAAAFDNLPSKLKLAARSLILLLFGVGAGNHFSRTPPVFAWCGFTELTRQIQNETDEPVRIFAFDDLTAYQIWHEVRADARFQVSLVKGFTDMPNDAAYFLPRGFNGVKIVERDALGGDKFYLAFADDKFDKNRQVLTLLKSQNYRLNEPREIKADGGISAFLVSVER